mgnify:CR=1 FL=1
MRSVGRLGGFGHAIHLVLDVGGRTVDEMAHLNEQLIYITEEDYQRIVEERRKRISTQN